MVRDGVGLRQLLSVEVLVHHADRVELQVGVQCQEAHVGQQLLAEVVLRARLESEVKDAG